jgi:hypothetical protein
LIGARDVFSVTGEYRWRSMEDFELGFAKAFELMTADHASKVASS